MTVIFLKATQLHMWMGHLPGIASLTIRMVLLPATLLIPLTKAKKLAISHHGWVHVLNGCSK